MCIRDRYTDTFYTRRENDAPILVTQTRWHEDDLVGRLLESSKNEDADQWEVLTLPAMSEEERPDYDQRTEPDQPLWPGKYSVESLRKIKATVPVYSWLSLYQQRPSAAAGNLVKKESFKYCTLADGVLELGETKKYMLSQCKVFQTCDPAASEKSTADDFVLATWAQTPLNDLALIDLIKTRMETPLQVPLFRQQYTKWRPLQQWVETNGCLLYTSDAADDLLCVDLGGRRIIK